MSVSLIAKKAGVSIATVSRVLNNSRRVNPASADLVRKAVEELQLPPFKARKKHRTTSADKTRNIAIVSLGQAYRDWFGMPVIASAVAELTQEAQSEQHGVFITEIVNPKDLNAMLRKPDVDGAIVFVGEGATVGDLADIKSVLPVVRVMGAPFGPAVVDHVCVDNHAIGYLAADYLIKQGCKRPAFVTANPAWPIMRLRAQGFQNAMFDAGLIPTSYIIASGVSPLTESYGGHVVSRESLDELMHVLSGAKPEHDGVFIANDATTVLCHPLLTQKGVDLGGKLKVISCDNEEIRLGSLFPRPASVDLQTADIAKRAIAQLQARMNDPLLGAPVVINVSPQIRA